ncbi:hypothetical protein ABZU92_22035 [Micromonospora arida]|uniref:hypothetical protein n=1 Tax=Micromonospora arida TaxID=2203715 RepID=UPI0033B79693
MSALGGDVLRAMSVPGPWILLALEVVFAVMVSLSTAFLHLDPSPSLALGFVPALAGLFGALTGGADARFGSLAGEVLTLGGPVRYTLRMLRVTFGLGLVGGAVGGVLTAATWWATLDVAPPAGRLTTLVLASAVAAGSWALLGAALAIVTQAQIGAVAVVLG